MGTRTYFNHRSLAFIVLITGILGGLLIVFSILLLCKYCLNRKNLREAEQMKLLYETLNQASLLDSNRLIHRGIRECSPLEPRRSNPLDRYQIAEDQRQIPGSKQVTSDYHSSNGQSLQPNQSYHEIREHIGNKQNESHIYRNTNMDDEQAYLQVDPRCYVRQNSNISLTTHRKSDTPRLEKGHSLNVDTRSSPSATSLSPYRQSSFDVTFACRSQPQPLTSSPASSIQQEIYYTPRGSSLSVIGNPLSNTSTISQHLSPPTPSTSRKNSNSIIVEKKNLTATIDPLDQTSKVRASIAQREHEISQSLEQSSSCPPVQEPPPSNYTTNDKQSRSFDAVHLLRPGTNRSDAINRRTKSYEYADDHRPSISSIAPPPIIIKIPDMTELVQAAQLSQLKNRRENTNIEEYQRNTSRKATLVQQASINDYDGLTTAAHDLWRLRHSYEFEQQQLDRTSPDEFSPDLSTSIDSAGALPIHNSNNSTISVGGGGGDDDPLKYQYRRKSSSNLLLPPPEVRRQALRRTFEKRRSCINQSNNRREERLLKNQNDLDDENNKDSIIDFSSLLNNFNSKSDNSSFERSLETDFDMQSDTSSRGPNDQFTSIESSGNENALPDVTYRQQQQQPEQKEQQQQQQQQSPHQDDSGYRSLESQNRTFSLDWMSHDGIESVIYIGDARIQQRSVDVKDLDDDLAQQQQQQQQTNNNRSKILQKGLHHSYQEASTNLIPPKLSNSHMMQQRSLSTNIPLVENHKPNPMNLSIFPNINQTYLNHNNTDNHKIISSSSFIRSASKKRREFSKDKRNTSSNVIPSHIATDEYPTKVYQINETNTKSSSSSLQVRHPDLRRTKSDDTRNLILQNQDDSSTKELALHSHEAKSDTHISSNTDSILLSTSSSSPIRQHLSPTITNTISSRHILQRSPSTTTSSVSSNPQVEAFRSQRGSISFDNQTPLINPSTSSTINKTKVLPTYSILPTCITKPRLKFSMVRDTAMASLSHNAPVYSMPIIRDYSIDEKTNRIVNEFLMHDPSLDGKKKHTNDDISYRGTPKRHYHRIRQKTLEETISINSIQKQSQQQPRSPVNKQRHHSSLQTNLRKHSHNQYPSIHLSDNIEQHEEEDSSDPASPLLKVNQQLIVSTRRDNNLTVESPSIIITGDDSGSQ
ncbi:unnamed protein product [Rotaria sordida]|uniref:Uncharacterized protein n=1 Tax=Rotaria sordida TaxID=392033 RepID=A0A813SZC6_9BILA|nr:unnamed protein product [Rotaria sordida]CAF3661542.1 unnamed protein product [Rotaria sordida]